MPKLSKVLKAATISGKKREDELQMFLIAYRSTPHSTTKIPPAVLMFNRNVKTGIPCIASRIEEMEKYHTTAIENDRKAKEYMKREYDARMKTRECTIVIGDWVMVRRDKKYRVSPWDPELYTVTGIKGSMIEATRFNHHITRNSSFFKILSFRDSNLEESVPPCQIAPQPELQPTNPFSARREDTQNVSVKRRAPGRPTSEQSNIIQVERALVEFGKAEANPPTRVSERLKKQIAKGRVDVM